MKFKQNQVIFTKKEYNDIMKPLSENARKTIIFKDELMPHYEFKSWHSKIKKRLGKNWRKWKVTTVKGYLLFSPKTLSRKEALRIGRVSGFAERIDQERGAHFKIIK